MSEKKCCAPSCCNGDKSQTADQNLNKSTMRDSIREVYKVVAGLKNTNNEVEQSTNSTSCCSAANDANLHSQISTRLGYSQADLDLVPEGADLGVGCGNPRAIANIKEGETIVDLGSGAGLDCFLASPIVGETGRVIGIDMTAEMISKARENAKKHATNNSNAGGFDNVEFRLGEIENLPIADSIVDVIISNCVINLSPDKAQVFREAYRVLKTGGRLAISDVVSTEQIPEKISNDPMMIAGCMGNTALVDDLKGDLEAAGFSQISIETKEESRSFIKDWAPGTGAENYVIAATIEAKKA